jgi:hypothetical protein
MLKDRIFYPLAALLAISMVFFALSFGETTVRNDEDIWCEGYVMAGEGLAQLTAQPGTQAVFIAASGAEPAYARLISTVARATIDPRPGIFAPLGPDYEQAFATQRLRLTIIARSSAIQGLEAFDMGYFTAGSGDSPWIRKPLTPVWDEYVMEYTPGALSDKRGLDHFSMWPGETAEPLTMDVREMRVEVLEPPITCP